MSFLIVSLRVIDSKSSVCAGPRKRGAQVSTRLWGEYVKLSVVTSIQVADETFVAAAPELAATALDDRGRWRHWWPDLRLTVTADRGAQGVRWTVAGPVAGTMEIWCEPVMDGFVLHYFLHGEPAGAVAGGDLVALNHRYRVLGKRMSFEIKDRLESGRSVGDPAVTAAGVDG